MSEYNPYHFKIFVAMSTKGTENTLNALYKSVQEFNKLHPPYNFEIIGCHNSANVIEQSGRKQNEYNSMIHKSHIMLTVIENDIGEFTEEEFEEGFLTSTNRLSFPMLCLMIKRKELLSDSVKKFTKKIQKKGQYWNWFDTEKDIIRYLTILMQDVVKCVKGRIDSVLEDAKYNYPVTIGQSNNCIILCDDTIVEGDFERGLPSGQCILTRRDGSKIKGKFHVETERIYNNKIFTGFVCYRPSFAWGHLSDEKQKYRGELTGELEPNGYGKSVTYSGKKIVGFWENGLLEGKALFYTNGGGQYEGTCHRGWPCGYGKYKFSDGYQIETNSWDYDNRLLAGGGKYSGMVYSEKGVLGLIKIIPCGEGKIEWANNESYKGEVREDCQNGVGKYTFCNGSKYFGLWVKGCIKEWTWGTFEYSHNHKKIKGYWKYVFDMGVSNNTSQKFLYTGTLFKAEQNLNEWEISGFGKLYTSNKKIIYIGDFDKGRFCGNGYKYQ